MLRAITVTRCWAGVAARQLSGSAGVPANLELATPPEKEKLIVFDTSLRDGEQSPGVTLGLEQKCVKTKITTPPLPRLFSGLRWSSAVLPLSVLFCNVWLDGALVWCIQIYQWKQKSRHRGNNYSSRALNERFLPLPHILGTAVPHRTWPFRMQNDVSVLCTHRTPVSVCMWHVQCVPG